MSELLKSLNETTTLHNGVKMPWLGLGVWKAEEGAEVQKAVKAAIKAGYKAIDTAAIYKNEEGVGQAIKDSGISRNELFVTTKVWNTEQGYNTTLHAFDESRKKLGLDYVDLYLIHWPVKGEYKDTWRALEKLYQNGDVRAIGVSNFHQHHLEDLFTDCEIKPMVDQVECHPKLSQKPLLEFCKKNKIQMEAWSPLMQGQIVTDPIIVKLADKYDKSPAQIVIRWDLQNGIVTIPKSVKEHRIIENASVFDFDLFPEDMKAIDDLNEDKRVGTNPEKYDKTLG